MVLKIQTISPLETIYEESGSFISSTVDNQQDYEEETISGLISARSIPSVDYQRQRAKENEQKPPIEVRFRDGSKRFIYPSTTATMLINRRNLLNSSDENVSLNNILNSNYQQLLHKNFNTKNSQKKPPLVLTIITADDMEQAGITSTRSSSTSGSDNSTITESQANSPWYTVNSLENIHEAPSKQSSTTTLVQPSSVNNSTPSLRSTNSVSSYSLQKTVHQNSLLSQLPSVTKLKPKTSSVHFILPTSENETHTSLNSNLTNKIMNKMIQSTTTKLVENPHRTAFRPFLKPIQLNQKPIAIKPRVPSTIIRQTFNPIQQHQQIVPYSQFYHEPIPSNMNQSSYQPTLTQKSTVSTHYSYDSLIPTQAEFNVPKNPSTNFKSLSETVNTSNYQNSNNYISDNSFDLSDIINLSTNSDQTVSFATSPTMQWLNVTSNSVYDLPRIASQYSHIPLRVTLPPVAETHNQNLVIKHNTDLEKRLLNAGLSPETVALYERIIDVAENRQRNIFSSPEIIDQYSYKSFI